MCFLTVKVASIIASIYNVHLKTALFTLHSTSAGSSGKEKGTVQFLRILTLCLLLPSVYVLMCGYASRVCSLIHVSVSVCIRLIQRYKDR